MTTGPNRSDEFFTPQELEDVELDAATLSLVKAGVLHIATGYALDLQRESESKSPLEQAGRIGRREGRTETVERMSAMVDFLIEHSE